MRLVGGAWCIVAFVLVTAYSSVLTSFITAPHSLPLVETAKDVAEKPNVNPVTVRALGIDFIISVYIIRHYLRPLPALRSIHKFFEARRKPTVQDIG